MCVVCVCRALWFGCGGVVRWGGVEWVGAVWSEHALNLLCHCPICTYLPAVLHSSDWSYLRTLMCCAWQLCIVGAAQHVSVRLAVTHRVAVPLYCCPPCVCCPAKRPWQGLAGRGSRQGLPRACCHDTTAGPAGHAAVLGCGRLEAAAAAAGGTVHLLEVRAGSCWVWGREAM